MDDKQLQCLLTFLGFGCGEIDGIMGPRTRAALGKFQQSRGLTKTDAPDTATETALLQAVGSWSAPAEVADPWEGIQYFTPDEFRCKCGGVYCGGFPAEPEGKLLALADRVRKHFGAAAIVSSGVRCGKHNANVGGVTNSRHLKGKAMDFRVAGKTAEQVLAYVQTQPETRYAYAIDKNYLHMDVE